MRRYLLPTAIWIFVVVYIVWASHLAKSAYSAMVIERMEIEIVDSTADRRLVTGQMVRNWINRSGIEVAGCPVRSVDLQGIERVVAGNGFVGSVSAYSAADGVLRIEVSQRTPLLRLLVDGYDRYVTSDGFVFGTPASSAIYVPVVTGSYRPQFPASFEGYASEYCEQLISGDGGIQQKIRDLKEQRSAVYAKNAEIEKRVSAWKKVNTRKSRLDGQVKREWKDQKAVEKAREIKLKQDSIRRNNAEAGRLNARISDEQLSIKKTREKYEDFSKLLNFVRRLERDGFWQSEIVQIVAKRSSSGVLELDLIPRSGRFVIEFGEIADVDAKFDKLMKFYREGFRNLGWSEFSVVSVAYKGQVVCKRRADNR